jgi:hypothetical protein
MGLFIWEMGQYIFHPMLMIFFLHRTCSCRNTRECKNNLVFQIS